MPGKGYSTIGLKPCTMARLKDVTDRFYPGMFYPSTLIIMMNEAKLGRYVHRMHDLRLDFAGDYRTITVRADVREWLSRSHGDLGELYLRTYRIRSFAGFLQYFLENMFESKLGAQAGSVRLDPDDMLWLRGMHDGERGTFLEFAESYVRGIIRERRERSAASG